MPWLPNPRRLCSSLLPLLFVVSLPAQSPSGQGTSSTLAEAKHLRAHGQLTQAATALNQVLNTAPDDVAALTELARVKVDQNDQPAAETLLTRALDISPNSPEVNDLSGSLLLTNHHYPEAMDHFETTLAVAPQDSVAHSGEFEAATALALQAKSTGHTEAALLCLEHAAAHLPGNIELLTDIGVVAGDLHLYQRAERSLTAALALDPHNARALYAAGRVATDAQHLPEAECYLRAYLQQKPSDATAHFGLGHVLAMAQNTPAATAEFERSIALQPAQSESFYQLGVLAANSGNDPAAEAFFRKTLTRNPHHGGALTGLGQIAYRRKDYSAAQASLSAAIQAAPDYQPAHYYFGLTLARLGQSAASTRELDKATELTQQQQSKATPERSDAATP